MRTTVTLDDDLLADVEQLSGIRDRSQLLREALLEMRHRLASRRLASLAGSEPGVVAPPRRRGTEPEHTYDGTRGRDKLKKGLKP